MHGNRKISERSPDGKTSETIFAMPGFSPGIQQGVTISLLAKSNEDSQTIAQVFYNDNMNQARAEQRREALLESLHDAPNAHYETALPAPENRYSLRPRNIGDDYAQWPTITELCGDSPSLGNFG